MSEPNSNLPFQDARAVSGLMALALDPAAASPEIASGGGKFTIPAKEDLAAKFPSLEILGRIGSGGMGCVYKARQRDLDRIVALKILPAELGRDAKFTERFGREARALARLSHPNIVSLFEIGEVDGLHYLVMEYMDGMNLREFMTVEQSGGIDVVDVMTQICSAVQYAHDQGIVHRDIKPENVLFDCRGHVKIADFGLAKLEQLASQDITLTGSRQAMGTLHYMAPEQWNDPHNVDHRADIYALGVMLYELVTGRLPLGHFDPPSVLAGADTRVDDIVMKSMQSSLESRYQAASDLAADLQQLTAVASKVPVVPIEHGGTFTQFLNVGDRVRNIARRVAVRAEPAGDDGFPWLTACWLIAICGLSAFGNWVGGDNGFECEIPYLPVLVPNILPFLFAIAIFVGRVISNRASIKMELLTVLFCGLGIAHVVVFYAAPEMVYPVVRITEPVSILPGIVGFLFVLMLLDVAWSLFVRGCGSVEQGARVWGSWVGSMNQRVMDDVRRLQGKTSEDKQKHEEALDLARKRRQAFFQRLRRNHIGPKKMWDVFGVADSEEERAIEELLFEKAVEIAKKAGTVTAPTLRRELGIGSALAKRVLNLMEQRGVVGPKAGSQDRAYLR